MAVIKDVPMDLIKEAIEVIEKFPDKRIVTIIASIAAWCQWIAAWCRLRGISTGKSAAQVFWQAWRYLNLAFYSEIRDWVTSHPLVFAIISIMLIVSMILDSFQTKNVYSSNLSTTVYLCAFVKSMQETVSWSLIGIFILCWIVAVGKTIYSRKEESILGIKGWWKSENKVDDIFWIPLSALLVLLCPLLLLKEILNVK